MQELLQPSHVFGDSPPRTGFAVYAAFACRLRAAHRAFIRADSFFLAAGLIWGRPAAFFAAVFTGFIGDPPLFFLAAHRAFIAAEMRLRAAALKTRRFPPVTDFGGRPATRSGALQCGNGLVEPIKFGMQLVNDVL